MSDSGHLNRSCPEGTTSVEVSFPTKYSNWSDLIARVAELEGTIEHLKALLAATQKALIIEPGKTYVIEIPGDVTTEEYEHLCKTWQEMTQSKAVILVDGWHVARSTP